MSKVRDPGAWDKENQNLLRTVLLPALRDRPYSRAGIHYTHASVERVQDSGSASAILVSVLPASTRSVISTPHIYTRSEFPDAYVQKARWMVKRRNSPKCLPSRPRRLCHRNRPISRLSVPKPIPIRIPTPTQKAPQNAKSPKRLGVLSTAGSGGRTRTRVACIRTYRGIFQILLQIALKSTYISIAQK